MKGDIAVAGFRISAEEWQALDPWARAELVAVITYKEEPTDFAAGSGPIPLELEPDPESGAIQSHGQLAGGADSGAIVGLRDRAVDVAVVAVMCRTEVAAVESAAPAPAADLDLLALRSRTTLAPNMDSGPVIMIERDEQAAETQAVALGSPGDVAAELDFGSL